MPKTILVTGSTDGIGLETAKLLASAGHTLLLHGRDAAKLKAAESALAALPGDVRMEGYLADLSDLNDVQALAQSVALKHKTIDVLINNAGVLKTANPVTPDGLDVRFAVNTIAPYLLTKRLLPLLGTAGRVVNLSSAAQAPVDVAALVGPTQLADMAAYAQSKLAITMWSRALAQALPDGPAIIAVNPGSLLGSKMVKEGFGIAGSDIRIGAEIVARAALADDFAGASGQYFDNDAGRFASPHPDALDDRKAEAIVRAIEDYLQSKGALTPTTSSPGAAP